MRDEDKIGTEAYVSILIVLAILIGLVVSLFDITKESDLCAHDMIYYLTPYQRQSLLLVQYNPSFEELSNFCEREDIEFSDILSARKNLSRFDTRP